AGPEGPTWPASPQQVPYLELAKCAEARGRHFDAWLLYGKASEVANGAAGEVLRRRAQAAMAAELPACAEQDAARAVQLGEVLSYELLVRALESLGRVSAARLAAQQGAELLGGSPAGKVLEEWTV
ncbi:unnamed protein product, partial [Effrenium voratum]